MLLVSFCSDYRSLSLFFYPIERPLFLICLLVQWRDIISIFFVLRFSSPKLLVGIILFFYDVEFSYRIEPSLFFFTIAKSSLLCILCTLSDIYDHWISIFPSPLLWAWYRSCRTCIYIFFLSYRAILVFRPSLCHYEVLLVISFYSAFH